MKKSAVVALVLALVFALCLPMSAMAADSPVITLGNVSNEGTVLPANTQLRQASVSAAAVDAMRAAIAEKSLPGELLGAYELILVDASGNAANGTATIRVNVSGLRSFDSIAVLHVLGNGSVELLSATCYNGYFEFTTNSFSPFGFLLNRGTAPSGNNGSATSPQTGVYA